MSPPQLPCDVIVYAYLPPLTLSLGYVQVEGLWEEVGRLVQPSPERWRGRVARPPEANWKKIKPPGTKNWKTERP